ncbi:MAG: cell division protein FtsL [Halioglobus sp.]|nr:cell division protein FtsL [Halioglobus sp.]
MVNSRVVSATVWRGTGSELVACNAVLVILVVLSAFAIVHSTHACRALYAKLQVLESSQWYLQEDYGRLLLEQSTWASHYRVEKVARGELGMVAPDLNHFKLVPQ